MIDLHSHIIWGIDDGSKSKEMTIKMLKIAEKNGTKKIVATPHFCRGVWEVSIDEVKKRLEDIKVIANENNISIELYSGQEVYYSEDILNHYKESYIGTINDSRYMLIEFPLREFNMDRALDNIYELQLKGIVPIMAHPERYRQIVKNPSLINKFIEEGFLFQLDSGSLTNHFGKEVKKTAKIFLENNIYSFIGSDGHRDEKRDTNLKDAMTIIKNMNRSYVKAFNDNGRRVIEDIEINFVGKKIKEKRKGLIGMIFG